MIMKTATLGHAFAEKQLVENNVILSFTYDGLFGRVFSETTTHFYKKRRFFNLKTTLT